MMEANSQIGHAAWFGGRLFVCRPRILLGALAERRVMSRGRSNSWLTRPGPGHVVCALEPGPQRQQERRRRDFNNPRLPCAL